MLGQVDVIFKTGQNYGHDRHYLKITHLVAMVPPRVGACLGGSPAGGPRPGGLDRGLPRRLTKVPGTADRPVECAGEQHWRRPGNSIVGCIGDDSEAESEL